MEIPWRSERSDDHQSRRAAATFKQTKSLEGVILDSRQAWRFTLNYRRMHEHARSDLSAPK